MIEMATSKLRVIGTSGLDSVRSISKAAGRVVAGGLRRIGDPRIRNAFDLQDLFVFGGLACIWYGLWLAYPPAAWVAVGAALFWLGLRS